MVIPGAPYSTNVETLDRHACQIAAHGDDMSFDADGSDSYRMIKSLGRFREYKRTRGISTTDIISRILLKGRDHHLDIDAPMPVTFLSALSELTSAEDGKTPFVDVFLYQPQKNCILQLINSGRLATDKADTDQNGSLTDLQKSEINAIPQSSSDTPLVYIDGSWDLFHAGQIAVLRYVKQNFKSSSDKKPLIVLGMKSDASVNRKTGFNRPILNMHERTLNAVCSRFVDVVVMNSPECFDISFLNLLFESLHVKGVNLGLMTASNSSIHFVHGRSESDRSQIDINERYAIPKSLGIFSRFDRISGSSSEDIIARIVGCAKHDFVHRQFNKDENLIESMSLTSKSSHRSLVDAVASDKLIDQAGNSSSTAISKWKGLLIVLEGLDRSGKSSVAEALMHYLSEKKIPHCRINFPERNSLTGQMIDQYLKDEMTLDDHAIHLLFSANRWECLPRLLKELNDGKVVLLDRYIYSGIAYSASKGLDWSWCENPDMGLPVPDAVIFLEINEQMQRERGDFGKERYEKSSFQQNVRKRYQRLRFEATQSGRPWLIIDANGSRGATAASAVAALERVISDHGMSTANPSTPDPCL